MTHPQNHNAVKRAYNRLDHYLDENYPYAGCRDDLRELNAAVEALALLKKEATNVRRNKFAERVWEVCNWALKGTHIPDALQSTPPAQPTADAVERLRAALHDADRVESISVMVKSADLRDALSATMAGDYVMVPREATEAMLEAGDTVEVDGVSILSPGQSAVVWSAMLSASPTGGE